jgi:hypothetical protein
MVHMASSGAFVKDFHDGSIGRIAFLDLISSLSFPHGTWIIMDELASQKSSFGPQS